MRLGVFTPTGNNGWIPSATSPQYKPTFDLNRSVVTRAERYGFDFALCMVKFRGFGGETEFWDYTLETFTTMSALAAVTSKIRTYTSVGVLSLHPAVVARMASTMDSVAPGRIGLNIVSGWNREEYAQMGMWPGDEYFSYRYDYSSEYVQIMKELWSTGRSDFKGRYFQLDDCRLGPVPEHHVDIIAAGSSPRGRRFAAEFADYNFTDAPGGVDGLAKANAELAQASRQAGREVSSIVLRQVMVADTDEDAQRRTDLYNAGADRVAQAHMAGNYKIDSVGTSSKTAAARLSAQSVVSVTGGLIAGSPATVAEMLTKTARVEGTSGILMSFDDYDEGLDRFGREVVPLLDFELEHL
jgi:pyrimidine oxygenase